MLSRLLTPPDRFQPHGLSRLSRQLHRQRRGPGQGHTRHRRPRHARSQQEAIVKNIGRTAWFTARIAKLLENNGAAFRSALSGYKAELDRQSSETPYGVPYRPSIWGAGWDIQRFGFEYYFLHAAYPDLFPKETIYNALNFILGCHPGSNTASFASGVGARSATVAYGLNRADWSYIPGGVVSGTALIRPDFPELLEFPLLWQQTEYVLGGGSSHYMFLVLAANTKK